MYTGSCASGDQSSLRSVPKDALLRSIDVYRYNRPGTYPSRVCSEYRMQFVPPSVYLSTKAQVLGFIDPIHSHRTIGEAKWQTEDRCKGGKEEEDEETRKKIKRENPDIVGKGINDVHDSRPLDERGLVGKEIGNKIGSFKSSTKHCLPVTTFPTQATQTLNIWLVSGNRKQQERKEDGQGV